MDRILKGKAPLVVWIRLGSICHESWACISYMLKRPGICICQQWQSSKARTAPFFVCHFHISTVPFGDQTTLCSCSLFGVCVYNLSVEPLIHCSIQAGDALFIPEGWWHQVDSTGGVEGHWAKWGRPQIIQQTGVEKQRRYAWVNYMNPINRITSTLYLVWCNHLHRHRLRYDLW